MYSLSIPEPSKTFVDLWKTVTTPGFTTPGFTEDGNRLAGRPCLVLGSDQRIYIQTSSVYTYPDITVVPCDNYITSGWWG